MMKKISVLLLIFLLLFSLTACGTKEEKPENKPLSQTAEDILKEKPGLVSMSLEDLYELTGMDGQTVQEGLYLSSSDGLGKEEVIVLRMTKDADMKDAEKKLNAYLAQRKEETRDYLPEVFSLLEKAHVTVKNQTLTLIVSPDQQTFTKDFPIGD